jgi:hypothetical protein
MSIGLAPADDRCRSAIAKMRPIAAILAACRAAAFDACRECPYDLGPSRRSRVQRLAFVVFGVFVLMGQAGTADPQPAAPETPPASPTAPATAPSDLHRGPDYIGEAAFVDVGTLTVVYPAGPGEPVDDSRHTRTASRSRPTISSPRNRRRATC